MKCEVPCTNSPAYLTPALFHDDICELCDGSKVGGAGVPWPSSTDQTLHHLHWSTASPPPLQMSTIQLTGIYEKVSQSYLSSKLSFVAPSGHSSDGRDLTLRSVQSIAILLKTIDTNITQIDTSKRLQLIDAYMGFILITGVVQFVHCVLVGTFPFNSFLAGFTSCVGSFVIAGGFTHVPHPLTTIRSQSANPDKSSKLQRIQRHVSGTRLHRLCGV